MSLEIPTGRSFYGRDEPLWGPPTAGDSQGDCGMIRLIEEISINAWPAFQTSLYDGWVIRFAGGFSRRSNSILPLYPSRLNVMEKIRRCEGMYRARNQRTIFKLTPASDPRELDGLLSDEGSRPEAETGGLTLPIRNWK